jgi:ketosteroid isomerase-like protein
LAVEINFYFSNIRLSVFKNWQKKNNKLTLSMQNNLPITIAHKWFDAFNNHNLEALLSLYVDDAQHYSPKLKIHQPHTNGLIKGKAELRNWWQDAFERLPSLQYNIVKLTTDDEQVFMEYTRHVDGEPDMQVSEVLEIKNGLIVSSKITNQK